MRRRLLCSLALAAGPCLAQGPAPCGDAVRRQFDFWVGRWTVISPSGVVLGVNVVTADLDGCVVQESWTAVTGFRGRSLNAVDATGRWHQTWVAQRLGHLRMRGGLVGDTMVLTGTRVDAATRDEYRDEYRWITTGDTVVQTGALDVPARDIRSRFRGLYVRADTLPVIVPADSVPCAPGGPGGATRWLDFWVGDWRVEGDSLRGTSRVTADLGGCLIEERLRASGGYAALTWTYYDVLEDAWYRTVADNRGARREYRGRVVDGVLLLAGTGDDGALRLRVTARGDALVTVREEAVDGTATTRVVRTRRYERVWSGSPGR